MVTPDFVRKGDKIAIVSTARKINKKEINEAIYTLESWNLKPVIGATIGIENNQFAGSDEDRRADFQRMLDDPEIKAIWCARGGYGTVRIIDLIDFSNFQKHPKWVVGYSDITVLHAHIHNFDISTIHGVMPIDVYKCKEEAKQSLKDILFGNQVDYKIPFSPKNKIGYCEGELVGGNLSILYSLCGSASSIDARGKILCIEDLDEYLYHIDRMLQNLKRNKYFDQLAGLIIGGMTKMHDNNIPFGMDAEDIILDIVKEYDFPVLFNFPMGHIEDNRALMLGAKTSLEVGGTTCKLRYI
ncbi:LD-carboxypeptidase [Aquimarina sp. RZ0]|uniref:S66 peptidase family protein n=1 Tax=Aquimarina sp. RZ0 TaxID=2607730 RepID=UPI0011F0FA35|nr:LD-carboxypeptidase [Aquimarina sp. RZ0]KAA1246243.1 LD-carboxypeptidase [Aquimarina sp. RZ0]